MSEKNQSEVARLLQSIAQEWEAAENGLRGYASVARHDVISAHSTALQSYHQQLIPLVGEEDAIRLVAQTVWPDKSVSPGG